MPDLKDGETVEMQGSGSKPYQLKNVGGVYSCSCPAWRNQSLPIERRTCKHLRKLRGDAAEEARIGGAVPVRAKSSEPKEGPPLLLAERWDRAMNVAGWWMSEKLDGVRAYWDGKRFLSRLGNVIHAPDWFVAGLPETPLDGELWMDRKKFQLTVAIVRRQDKPDTWKQIRYIVFDAPAHEGVFEARLHFLEEMFAQHNPPYARLHPHELCRDTEHVLAELARVEELGAEGLMLRKPGSKYEPNRSLTLLKVKSFIDAEGRVVGHKAGAGRHKGRLGALQVEMDNGVRVDVGTGFSDAERENPPPIGSIISFRYQELSDGGVPRFPSFVGMRDDVELATAPDPVEPASSPEPAATKTATKKKAASRKPAAAAPSAAARKSGGVRHFECVAGKSSKFWEVSVSGKEMTTRWGKIGSKGQSKTKTFADAAAAAAAAAKLVEEKTDEGYVEKG